MDEETPRTGNVERREWWRANNRQRENDLIRKWDIEGKTAAEIARDLGCTKNAVIGKAHRLGCKTRPSPLGGPRKDRPEEPALTVPETPTIAPDAFR